MENATNLNDSTDREWFVRNNAAVLLQERDEKIERQRIEIARLTRAVESLKRELDRDNRSLKSRWRFDPFCHWCAIQTALPARTPKGGPPDNQATLDHLISKRNGNGERGKEAVLACYFCNFQRNNAEQKQRAVIVERNGSRITFLPSGRVLCEEEDKHRIAQGAQAATAAPPHSEQAAQTE